MHGSRGSVFQGPASSCTHAQIWLKMGMDQHTGGRTRSEVAQGRQASVCMPECLHALIKLVVFQALQASVCMPEFGSWGDGWAYRVQGRDGARVPGVNQNFVRGFKIWLSPLNTAISAPVGPQHIAAITVQGFTRIPLSKKMIFPFRHQLCQLSSLCCLMPFSSFTHF